MGIDIHIILVPAVPSPIPTPIPHPYTGFVFDPMAFSPIVGTTVMVNGLPAATAGTSGQAIPPHIPIGGMFLKPPSNESEMFMGSATVLVDGEPMTFMGLPVLSCSDVGMPAPPRAKKSPPMSLMLPQTGNVERFGGTGVHALFGSKGSTRMRRQACTTTASATTIRRRGRIRRSFRLMNRFEREVLEAGRTLGVDVQTSAVWSGISIQKELAVRFGSEQSSLPLWERLKGGVSLQNPDGWTMPAEFVGEAACLLCFEPRLDNSVLEFRHGADLTRVLAECSGFLFYVCDSSMNYLLCFNDHDYLIAVGTAEPWLRSHS